MYLSEYLINQLDRNYETSSRACSYIDNDKLIVEFYAPGLSKDSVDLEIIDNRLLLKGEGKKKDKGFNAINLDKEYILPEKNIKLSKASAKYDAGIITVTLPLDTSKRSKIKLN
jgi:HSP20 family molecular chaperone IbpA